MIELKDISPEQIDQVNKIIEWKADRHLCDMIMAHPIKISQENAKFWIQKNSLDREQVLKGIFFKNVNGRLDFLGIARLMFIDRAANTAEVGLYIGDHSHRGKKVGKDALIHLITEYATPNNLEKLYSRIRATNVPSVKLFEGLGFVQEGILKNHYYSQIDNFYDDVILMGKFI